jgi:uncharacterized protein
VTPGFFFALFIAGVAGGALNAVAGGGSFIVFPTMLLSGAVAPVAGNATTAVALWPAGLTSAMAYREHLPRDRGPTLAILAGASALGGGLGAKLLLVTSDETFVRLLPVLMFIAAMIFSVGPRWTKRKSQSRLPVAVGVLVQLAIATYGGYFGGGMGIMMLATMTLMGMTHMHEMNALKVILGTLVNGVALVGFILAGKVVWAAATPVIAGGLIGGWAGASLARRVDPKHVRKVVLAVAWGLTAWFTYGALRK